MSSDLVQLCTRYIQGGELDRAEQGLRQLLREDPAHLQGLCLLGLIRQAHGGVEEAVALFKEAARTNPQEAAPYNHLGALFLQARRPEQALSYLEEALRLSPFFPEAYNNLGKAYLLLKRETDAIACFREAIHLRPTFGEALNNLALMHIARHEYDEAQPLLQRVLQAAPAYPGALISLSVIHFEKGELEMALTLARQAVQLQPHLPAVQDQVGAVLLKMGRHEEAVPHFQAALQAAPNYRPALEHLGIALASVQRPEEALPYLLRAVQHGPGEGRALDNLVALLMGMKRWMDVVQIISSALARQPNSPELLHNLGLAYLNLRRPGEAMAVLEQAVALRPEYAEARCSLGWALTDLGQFDRAAAVLRAAIEQQPDLAAAYNNLGLVYSHQGKLDEALPTYRQAVELRPDFSEALAGLANVCKDLGMNAEALDAYRCSLAANPHQPATHSNLLLSLHYPPGISREEIFHEHLTWARLHTAPAVPAPHSNTRDPERRLRIGYVSADLRGHVMGWYLEPILQAHDRERFEVFCYANISHADDTTGRLRRLVENWRDIRPLSDDEAEQMIRRDGIDLLLDLNGHTGGHRLTLFARKPAPVQASHFGYMDTSGLSAIDYRLTDAVCDPPGMTERYHTERLVRLPEILWCYQPNIDLAVNDLPAASSGRLTLGMLNAFPKINAPAIAAWSRILKRLPGARLLLLAHVSPKADQRLRDAFAAHGIEAERLILEGKRSRLEYFRLFQRIDLLLDSFPYAGCNTTCDSLWMGVPVVTLAGQTCMSRQGASPLAHLGLHEMITETVEEYEEKAVRLAADWPRLARLRAELRPRMSRSTLMNPARFTRQLEEAYRGMWKQYSQASGGR